MRIAEVPKAVKEYFKKGSRTIKKVIVNDDYTLTVHFDNGEIKLYDMNGSTSDPPRCFVVRFLVEPLLFIYIVSVFTR